MRRSLVVASLSCFLAADWPANGQQGDGTVEALEWAVVEAETALGHRELQIAESHYREALLEGWFLLGQIAAASEDLPTATAALERAVDAAAVPNTAARMALAALRMSQGEDDEAIQALRWIARQQESSVEAGRRLILALAAANRMDDVDQELSELRSILSAAADELAAMVASADDPRQLAPTVELGALADASAEQLAELRHQVIATLVRIYGNLGVLHDRAGRPERAATYLALATEVGQITSGTTETDTTEDGALGRIALRTGPPPTVVDRQWLDPVKLRDTVSESLMPVILLIDDGRLDEAEAELRRRLAEGESAEARGLLGAMLSHRERWDEAERELLAAIDAAPKSSLSARQSLARLLLLRDRGDEAIEQLRLAAEQGLLERDLGLELARAERQAGRRPAANHQLRSISRRFGSVRALIELSAIAADLRNSKLALDYAERAVAAAPSSEEVLALHTRRALAVRIPSAASRSIEPLAKMHPDVAEYHYLLGEVWAQLRNPGEAAESLLAAVALDPDLEEAFVPLGLALNHESRYDDARSYLQRFLANHPDDLEATAALAEAEERLGETVSAEKRVATVLARDAEHPTAQLVAAMLHMRERRFEEARAALEGAIAADPELAKAHYQLSQACIRLGDRKCAEEHLEIYRRTNLGPEGSFVPLESVSTKTLEQSGERQK